MSKKIFPCRLNHPEFSDSCLHLKFSFLLNLLGMVVGRVEIFIQEFLRPRFSLPEVGVLKLNLCEIVFGRRIWEIKIQN